MQVCKYCNGEFEFDVKRAFGAHVTNCVKNPKRNATIEKHRQTKTKPLIHVVLNCIRCGVSFDQYVKEHIFRNNKHKKCCSLKCGKANNRIGDGSRDPVRCLECGNNCNRYMRYCSKKCRGANNRRVRVERFLAGTLNPNSLSVLKAALIDCRGNICAWCSQGSVHNHKPLTLQLDHVDGNSDNNHPDNLRLLCPNCHSQTDTYKSRNKNSTRAKQRRLYYDTGKWPSVKDVVSD